MTSPVFFDAHRAVDEKVKYSARRLLTALLCESNKSNIREMARVHSIFLVRHTLRTVLV
jgi:hypothetical protein